MKLGEAHGRFKDEKFIAKRSRANHIEEKLKDQTKKQR
jgi:hypothetical protein